MSFSPETPGRETVLQVIGAASKAISFAALFKASAGLAMTALAGFGVIAPKIGLDVTTLNGGIAAAVGAVIGAVLAMNG
jgi:hypothetical protein